MRRLLGYYRQFEGLSEREVNERLRAEAAERRERDLARLEPLDLSRTTWPECPPPAVVNAITYAARRACTATSTPGQRSCAASSRTACRSSPNTSWSAAARPS